MLAPYGNQDFVHLIAILIGLIRPFSGHAEVPGLFRRHFSQLDAEVRDLKEGLEMVEEKARYELGMVKPDEIMIQVSTPKK